MAKDLDVWYEEMKEIVAACWQQGEHNIGMDKCPRCNAVELFGYSEHNLISCRMCEWTIDKIAWLEAWR